MKYFKIIVVASLLVSLLININMLSKMNNIENRVSSIANDQMQIMNSVNDQSRNLNNIINDFIQEQSWISSIQMDAEADEIEKGIATLNFEWQVKELYKNSEVVFHYLYGEKDEYSSIPAIELEDGLFKADIPIEVVLVPEWHISLTTVGSSSLKEKEEAKRAIEEMNIKENNNSQLSYYVTVSNDNLVKSSEINRTNIGNFGSRYYGFLDIHVNINDDSYNVSAVGSTGYIDSKISFQEAYLLKYRDGQLVDEEKLLNEQELIEGDKNQQSSILIQENLTSFHKQPSKEKFEYTRLVLKVVYSNGVSFEREIYSQ